MPRYAYGMSVTHGTATRTALADACVDRVDGGAAAGKLKIRGGTTLLCTITLADPAFGAASAGSAALSGLPKSGTAAATGVADNFQITDSDDNVIFAGSVTATGGGGDIEIDDTGITSGDTVTCSAGGYTAPV